MTEAKDIDIPLIRDDFLHLPTRRVRLNELQEAIGKLMEIEFLDVGDEVILYLSIYEREIMMISFFDEDVEYIKKHGLDEAIGKRVGILKIDREIRIKKI